jgi:hypothetical protein
MAGHDRQNQGSARRGASYVPPRIMVLGTLAELTQVKEPGAADGTQFLGIDIGT